MVRKTVVWMVSTWYIVVAVSNYILDFSWKLLLYDFSSGFRDNKAYFKHFFLPITLLCIIINVVLILMLERKITLYWQIRFMEYNISIGELHYIRRHRKMIYRMAVVGAVLLFILPAGKQVIRERGTQGAIWKKVGTIAHAGGRIDEYDYLNCLEAIQENYEKGHRVFEIDFSVTSDNKLICKHDWNYVVQEGALQGDVWDEQRFLSIPILGQYTPLSFETLCQVMMEYPDIWVVTDTRDTEAEAVRQEFETMVETAKELGLEDVLDRIIVQIYNEEMYDIIRKVYPFKSWIYTLYQFFGGDAETFLECIRFCYDRNIDGITTWNYYVTPELLQIAEEYGILYYAHTEDDVDNAKNMMSQGLTGVYTNIITPDMLKED